GLAVSGKIADCQPANGLGVPTMVVLGLSLGDAREVRGGLVPLFHLNARNASMLVDPWKSRCDLQQERERRSIVMHPLVAWAGSEAGDAAPRTGFVPKRQEVAAPIYTGRESALGIAQELRRPGFFIEPPLVHRQNKPIVHQTCAGMPHCIEDRGNGADP